MTAATQAHWHREAVKYRTLLVSIRAMHHPEGRKEKWCGWCGESWPCWEARAIDEALS